MPACSARYPPYTPPPAGAPSPPHPISCPVLPPYPSPDRRGHRPEGQRPSHPTSCWVLSVLLHSSLRFSSSEQSMLSHSRAGAPPGSSLLCSEAPMAPGKPLEGLRPASAKAAVASPMLGSSPASGPPSARLYSAHRFRMVSRRCRSWEERQRVVREEACPVGQGPAGKRNRILGLEAQIKSEKQSRPPHQALRRQTE